MSSPMNTGTIELNSVRNITVYQDLTYRDKSIDLDKVKVVVGESAKLLNVYPTWHNVKCYIKKGNGVYPANILDWTSTKSLIHRGIIKLFNPELNEKIKSEYGKAVVKEETVAASEPKKSVTPSSPTPTPESGNVKRPGRPPKLADVANEQ